MKLARISPVAAAALLVLLSACSTGSPVGPGRPDTNPVEAPPSNRPSYDGGTVHGSGG